MHGEPTSCDFNYSSVVGMLLFLARNTCPDVSSTVKCAAIYTFCQKVVHKCVLMQIGCYLEATFNKELNMKSFDKLLKIASVPDS